MRKQMIENAAYEVATQVRAVEDSIDATLAEMAELQSRMMRVTAIAHIGPAAIHPALQELSAALSTLLVWAAPAQVLLFAGVAAGTPLPVLAFAIFLSSRTTLWWESCQLATW